MVCKITKSSGSWSNMNMTKVNFFWKFHCFIKRINILHSNSWKRLYWKNIMLPKVNIFFITRLWTYWCVAKFVNWWYSTFCQSLLCDITSCSLFISILVLSEYRLLFLYEYCLARIKLALSVLSLLHMVEWKEEPMWESGISGHSNATSEIVMSRNHQ